MPDDARDLAGLRILVVEDEMLVAVMIEDILSDETCQIVGPHATLAGAEAAARDEAYDFALLDVNLRGENARPVAEIVAARGVPFLLLSGYGAGAVPADRPDWRALGKPFGAQQLVDAIRTHLAPA